MIISIHTTYSQTYLSVETIYNGSNNTMGRCCYSANQAVSRFAEHHIDMVSCIHCKCQTRDGVSWDINKSFECVIITDSTVSNRVLL